VGSLEHFMCC